MIDVNDDQYPIYIHGNAERLRRLLTQPEYADQYERQSVIFHVAWANPDATPERIAKVLCLGLEEVKVVLDDPENIHNLGLLDAPNEVVKEYWIDE